MRIEEHGFEKVGEWSVEDGSLRYNLETDESNVVYALIADGEIKYIGKTSRKLDDRMGDYQSAMEKRVTDHRKQQAIHRECLKHGSVGIWMCVPDEVNLNGLCGRPTVMVEECMIDKYQPEWNTRGISA